jgi:hypothetical protein
MGVEQLPAGGPPVISLRDTVPVRAGNDAVAMTGGTGSAVASGAEAAGGTGAVVGSVAERAGDAL